MRARAAERGKTHRREHPAQRRLRGFAEPDPVRRLALLAPGFLKADGEPYADKFFKNGAAQAHSRPAWSATPPRPPRSRAAADRLALFRMLEATRAALIVADWLIARYEQLKAARGFLDFNDLITRTVRLLSRPDVGPWVQYKLDQGIDHILIDEAQDTSPDQWDVVRRLAEEFFAGLGARDDVHRTLFAVGDEKQSIYSFQGADPRHFRRRQPCLRRARARRRRQLRTGAAQPGRSARPTTCCRPSTASSPTRRRARG